MTKLVKKQEAKQGVEKPIWDGPLLIGEADLLSL